jgi:excisionase family DNA binding protein
MQHEFYSIKEVAVIFSVHECTIRRAIKKGFIVAVRIGNRKKSPYRISKKMIETIHTSVIFEQVQKVKKSK